MKFGLGLFLFGAALYAQTPCASQDPLQIVDSVQGTVNASSCKLSDGSGYAQYRLVVPVRGTMQFDAAFPDFAGKIYVKTLNGRLMGSGTSFSQYLESGDYAVVVNANTSGQTGNFTLKTNFTPEPNLMCDNFRMVALNQKLTANLTSASCKLPDGSPYDEYVVASYGKGTLDIQVDTSDYSPNIIIRDGYFYPVTSGGNHVSQDVESVSYYFILVAGGTADSVGKYNLTLSFTPDSKDTCVPKKVFSSTDTLATQITSGSCQYGDSSGGSALFDFYYFDVPDTGLAEFKAVSTSMFPELILYDPSGNQIAIDAFGGATDTSVIRRFLKPGRYTVELWAADDRIGDYQFSYTYRAGNPQACPSASFQSGGSAGGNVTGAASCPVGSSFGDFYSVTLPSAGTLTAKMNSSEIATFVQVLDAKDNVLTDDGNTGGEAVSNVTADLPAGAYTIAARSQFGSGNYNVSYQFAAKDIAACDSPKALRVDQSVSGDLTKSTCRDAGGQAYDLYEFTTTQDGTIEAAMISSSTVDSYLTLEDTQGKILRRDNDSLGQGDSLLVQFLPAGTYRLGARNAHGSPAGTYEVDLFFNPGARPAGCNPLKTLAPGDQVQAILDFTSCYWLSYAFGDVYKLEVAADGTYDLTLNSRIIDAYLFLLDAKGNIIDEDDDSGGRTNSKISRKLTAGTYYLVASTAYDFTDTGSYTLAVTKQP